MSALRAGKASAFIPVPDALTFIGHSAGSIAGRNLFQAYPDDIDTLMLTGYLSGPIAAIGAAAYYTEHNLSPPSPAPSARVTRLPGRSQAIFRSRPRPHGFHQRNREDSVLRRGL